MQIVQRQDQVPQGKTRGTQVKSSSVMQQQMALSQGIIPAVRGEYYSYASVFTEERPLYALMKCKSNKARLIGELSVLGPEATAFFQFNGAGPRILSLKKAFASGLLESMQPTGAFGDVWFAPTTLTAEQFMKLWTSKKTGDLVSACQHALSGRQVTTELREELVVAMMTDSGKYGMFLVEEVTMSSVLIEACHIQH